MTLASIYKGSGLKWLLTNEGWLQMREHWLPRYPWKAFEPGYILLFTRRPKCAKTLQYSLIQKPPNNTSLFAGQPSFVLICLQPIEYCQAQFEIVILISNSLLVVILTYNSLLVVILISNSLLVVILISNSLLFVLEKSSSWQGKNR